MTVVTNAARPSQKTIVLSGALDAHSIVRLRETFDELAQSPASDITVDLTYVTELDSSGVGALVFLYKRLKGTQRALCLEGLHGQPGDLVKMLRLDKTIDTRFVH